MEKFNNEFERVDIEKLLSLYTSQQIQIITIKDSQYPTLLKEIYDPPLALFMIGDLSLLQKDVLAIVGARKADHYAVKTVNLLLPSIIDKGIVIISGLAKGVDTIAHKQTIRLGGKTIAVLGSGFFHLYPAENRQLAKQIKQDHLLISEYPPMWRPQQWYFPMRNRIISGLAKGTVVVQAKRRSGSLITADYALNEGREVFAVPGSIDNPLSEGTNDLIQQGAKLVRSGNDILDELYLDD